MTVHVKKCHPVPFAAVADGSKPFEYRKEDDCRFEVGDELLLLEWQPEVRVARPKYDRFGWQVGDETEDHIDTPAGYTGETLRRCITYVLRGEFGVPEGYVVLGLAAPPQKPGGTP